MSILHLNLGLFLYQKIFNWQNIIEILKQLDFWSPYKTYKLVRNHKIIKQERNHKILLFILMHTCILFVIFLIPRCNPLGPKRFVVIWESVENISKCIFLVNAFDNTGVSAKTDGIFEIIWGLRLCANCKRHIGQDLFWNQTD